MSTLHELHRSSIKRNQARIIDLMRWDNQTYFNFQYNAGLEFLAAYFGNDEEAINILSARREFWNWWKAAFNVRDDVFVDKYDGLEDEICTRDMQTLYYDNHSSRMLVCEMHPPRAVYPPDFTHIKIEMA